MSMPQPPASGQTPASGLVLETLIRTTHRLHLQFEAHLATFGIPDYLTGPRLRFLMAVADAGRIRMSELAAKVGIKPRTVTQFVDALEQAKLIVRSPDPSDRRATFVQLSESAPQLMMKARSAMSASADHVLGKLPAEQRTQLLELLLMMSASNETAVSSGEQPS